MTFAVSVARQAAAGLAAAALLVLAGACVPTDRPGRADRESPVPSSPVGSWALASIDGQPLGQGSALVLELRADGTLGGLHDCNRIGGTWQLSDGNRLGLGPVMSTKMGCNADGAATQAFLTALQDPGGARFTLDGNRMDVTAAGRLGRFQRQ